MIKYFKSIKLIFFEISIQLYVHINSQHNLKLNYFNNRPLLLWGQLGNSPKNILTQQKLLKTIHIMKPQGKEMTSAFWPRYFVFLKKVLAQAIAHQKDLAPLNEKKFNSVEQLPKPRPWKNDALSLTSYCRGQNPVK